MVQTVTTTQPTYKDLQEEVQYLEGLVAKLTKENAELQKKRKDPPPNTKSLPKVSNPTAVKKAKMSAQRKRLFEKWIRSFNRELMKRKFTGYVGSFSVPIVDTSEWTKAEFEEMFRGKGTLIQTLSDCPSASSLMVVKFSYDELNQFFDDVAIPRQGYQARLFSNRGFLKSSYCGTVECKLDSMDASWDKANLSVTISFNLSGGKNSDPLAEFII